MSFRALACTIANLGLFIHSFTPHCLDLTLQFNDPTQTNFGENSASKEQNLLVREVSVLDLELLEAAVVEGDRVAVLVLPLLGDLFLLNHDAICALLITLIPFLGLKKLILQMGDLDIALIIELIDTTMEHNLHAVKFGDSALFLVPQLIDKLTQALIIVKVAFIVAHVGIKFDLLLMLEDGCVLSLVFDSLKLLLELLVLTLAPSNFFLAHGLLLVDLLVIVFVLHASIFLEGAPMILQLRHLLTQTVAIHAEPLRVLICIRELAAEIGQFITFLV